jgi:hypothetical protein
MPSENYEKALSALQSAHNACFNHPDRSVLGMSVGPFSGVNVALGVITKLELEITELKLMLFEYKEQIKDLKEGKVKS